jgi:hypothetical protein
MDSTIKTLLKQAFIRSDCLKALAKDREFSELCAQVVAVFIESLPAGTRLVLYGCGRVSKLLATKFRTVLEDLPITFAETEPTDLVFYGFPILRAKKIAAWVPDHIILITSTYIDDMLEMLSDVNPACILRMEDVLTNHVDDKSLAAVLSNARELAVAIELELRERSQTTDKTACFLEPDMTGGNLTMLRYLQNQGFKVIVLMRRFDMVSGNLEDFSDYHYEAPSYELLRLLSLFLIPRYAFSVVFLWLFYAYSEFTERLVATSAGRTVVCVDTFLTQILEDPQFADIFHQREPIAPERVALVERGILARAAGIIYRHPEKINERFESAFGCRFKKLHMCQPMDISFRSSMPVQKYSKEDGRLHIAFICSLYKDPQVTVNTGYPVETIYEPIEVLTGAGIQFTVYNPCDVTGGFANLRRMAQENALFRYHPGIHFNKLIQELQRYDFGWMCRKISPVKYEYTRTHLPFAVFTFLTAGIPVIVSPELEHLSSFVVNNGVGIRLPYEEWQNIAERIAAFDIRRLHVNIDRYCRAFSPDKESERIAVFFDEIIAGDTTVCLTCGNK